MKRSEQEVHEALRQVRVPEESEAAARAWELVRAAEVERESDPSPRRLRRRGLQLALVVGVVAALVSPAGAAVRHWVADTVAPGVEHAHPALTSLPSGGSLLVQSAGGSWIVHADGSKRLLGSFDGATWSPHGLYVAATSRHELATVDPAGEVRWTLDRGGPVRLPSWNGPDGFRLAYLNGSSLRVVNGDGSDDHLLEPRVAAIAPAWKPGRSYVLAFAKRDGRVEAVRTDSGATTFATGPGPRPLSLQWSLGGRRLLVTEPTGVDVRGSSGRLRWRWTAPAGERVLAARLAPSGDHVAVIVGGSVGSRLLLIGPGKAARTIFSGPGRFSGVEWSPDGRWLLLAWKSADQWLFLNRDRPGRIIAIANVSEQFAPEARPETEPFPQVQGWCCSR